jgi:hypothetical protein
MNSVFSKGLFAAKALCFGPKVDYRKNLLAFTMNYLNKPRIHFEMAYLNETMLLLA